MIAVSHPGKIGDALYCLPTIRWLCNKHRCQADFFTSSYCEPLRPLFEYQPFIRSIIVPADYQVRDMICGVQPWEMPVPQDGYQAIYQLGFRQAPIIPLPDHIAETVSAPTGLPIYYDFPQTPTLEEPYLVIAPGRLPRYRELFLEVAKRSPLPVVNIGSKDEYLGIGIDQTGLDLLQTLPWIAQAKGFVGVLSSPLVLANAFPIPKVIPVDGITWDMRHVLQSPLNYYPLNPTPNQILSLLGLNVYSKVLHPKDYLWIGEVQHLLNISKILNPTTFRLDHEHRLWEYGIVLRALREISPATVLDVGGSASLFAPAAAWLGMEVTQIDPTPCQAAIKQQSEQIKRPLHFVQADFSAFHSLEQFDAVVCLSVLEHVEKDREFFVKLLQFVKPGGILALTVDFHPSGAVQTPGHLRTYNAQKLSELAALANRLGFALLNRKTNYLWAGAHVNTYNFASLIMRRERV